MQINIFCQNVSKTGITFASIKSQAMYIINFTLPSFNEEFAVLYHPDGPMLGQMKRNSGNMYPFNIFPERVERMGSLRDRKSVV